MLLRRAVKTAASWALYLSGADRAIAAARGIERQPLVLCYHRVVHEPRRHSSSAPAMLVSQRTLAEQLDWVGRRYRFVELDELAASIESGCRQRRAIAAVTFDDGYADVYRNALPVLRRKGIPAAVFVVTDLVGTRHLLVHDRFHVLLRVANRRFGACGIVSLLDRYRIQRPRWRADREWDPLDVTRLAERLLATQPRAMLDRLVQDLERFVTLPSELLEKLRPLDWQMLAEMRDAGVTVGSHTRSHHVLPNESEEDVIAELKGSKRTLEARLGTSVHHVSFPNGHFNGAILGAVRTAGYRYAYTSCFHRAPDHEGLTIPRRVFWEQTLAGVVGRVSPAVASCQVRGVFDGRVLCPHDHGSLPPGPASSRAEPSSSSHHWATPSTP